MHWANDPFKFFKCCLPQILKTVVHFWMLCPIYVPVSWIWTWILTTLCVNAVMVSKPGPVPQMTNLHAVFLIHVSFLGFYFHFAWNVWKSFLFPQLSQESLKLVPNKSFCFQIFKISNQKVAILIKMIHSRYVG